MSCYWCKDSGIVFAHRKDCWASAYGFRCECSRGDYIWQKAIPRWGLSLEKAFVPEYLDKALDEDWVVSQIEAGKQKEPEFQRRLEIWGRERFKNIWERHEAKKK